MGCIVCAISEVVLLVGFYDNGVRSRFCRPCHIHVDVVAQIVASLVLRIKQGEPVMDKPVAECLLVTLQRINIWVLHQLPIDIHAFCLRLDVLDFAALVIGSSAPVPLLLHVEHFVHLLLRQFRAHRCGHLLDFALKVCQHQAPQP